jgi:S-adenosylmethionine decarboxylase
MLKHWGHHLILNARRCNALSIQNPRIIELFATDMVKKIDMVAYGPPKLAHFGADNKSGWTLVQLIETSNIMGHFCDQSGDAYLDVFSCKPFDQYVARAVVESWFKPESVDMKLVKRDSKYLME